MSRQTPERKKEAEIESTVAVDPPAPPTQHPFGMMLKEIVRRHQVCPSVQKKTRGPEVPDVCT